MVVPVERSGDSKPKIFNFGDSLERSSFDVVVEVDAVPLMLSGDGQNLAFAGVELHVPIVAPCDHVVESRLQVKAVVPLVDIMTRLGVISVEEDCRSWVRADREVIDEEDEQEWSKNGALWDTRGGVGPFRFMVAKNHPLVSSTEVGSEPSQEITVDTIGSEFVDKERVVNHVEGLGEVHI